MVILILSQMRIKRMSPMSDMIGSLAGVPVNQYGDVPVLIQDQITPGSLGFFSQSVDGGNFTLRAPTQKSTLDTLYYELDLNTGHGLIASEKLILLDVAGDRQLQAEVISAGANIVQIDRPIDHNFPIGSIGRTVITDMRVDGSGLGNEEIFTVRAGNVPADYWNYIFWCQHTAATDGSKFCGLGELSRGVVFRIVDGFQQSLPPVKRDADIIKYGGQVISIEKSGGGEFFTFYILPIKEKFGITQRLSGTSAIQVIVQDDLTDASLLEVGANAIGHLTEGEVV